MTVSLDLYTLERIMNVSEKKMVVFLEGKVEGG